MRSSLLIGSLLLALAGCSAATNDKQAENATEAKPFDLAEAPSAEAQSAEASDEAAAAPDIGSSVAPGVAFTYAYKFAMPEARIAATQADHAALCETMGIAHCRVTGLEFRKSASEPLRASMTFLVDPAKAHRFSSDARSIVEKADGSVSDSNVSGHDAGAAIVAGDRSAAALRAELARIAVQLRLPGLSKDVRSRLVDRQAEINAELRAIASTRGGEVESLATTPVSFTYTDNAAILGFDSDSPIQQAMVTSRQSFMAMISFMIIAIGALAPWALLLFALFAIGRWLLRRLPAKRASAPVDPAVTTV